MSLDKIKALNDMFFAQTGKRRRMFFRTYGCQMNVHDSEKLEGTLAEAGYVPADTERDADIIVYNTCCVRENAENKVYGHLGLLKRLKKDRPDVTVVLCGCMMQQESVIEKIMKHHRHVNVVFGTYNIHRFAELLYTHLQTGKQVIDIWQSHGDAAEDLPALRPLSFKASVNIMYGCDNFCTYCIVPYVRGRERSRPSAEIISEIEALAQDGVKEVTLLGQNVNSYGLGLEEDINFAALLRKVNAVPGIEHIRFLTSHPKDLSDELIAAMQACEKVCRHLHLPVQSGSNHVLAAMNRQYTREHYLALIDKARAAMPGITVTTDIIVGFPGETEADFKDTMDIIEKVRFSGAFTFIYSVRTGTPAASMMPQVPEEVVKDRFNRMLSLLNPLILETNRAQIGRTLDVLVETAGENGVASGRSGGNNIVHVHGGDALIGRIVPVKITGCKTFYLVGELAVEQ